MTPRALAARIFAGLMLVVLLVGGSIALALSWSSEAGEKATTGRVVNVEQQAVINRNKATIERNTRKLNATLLCLATDPDPLSCVRRISGVRRRGAMGAVGRQGVAGGRGSAGIRGTVGSTGRMGEQGETGEAGAMGLPGVAVKGDKGEPGRAGVDGFNGADGPQGPPGPRGPAPAQIQTACPGPDGGFVTGFATDPDGDLTYSCP